MTRSTRREFTKSVKRQAYDRSCGLCEARGPMYGLDKGVRCNADLSKGVEYDHVVRAADGGEASLENCAAVCRSCHRHKTSAFDVPEAAKTKRMSDKSKGIRTKKKPIQSRGFEPTGKAPKIDKGKLPPLKPRQIYGEMK